MAWTYASGNPLLITPADNLINPGLESAFSGSALDNWQALGATTRVTGEGRSGVYCARFNPVGASPYMVQVRTLANIFRSYTLEVASGLEFYTYFWAKAKAHTGNAYLQLNMSWKDSAFAVIGSTAETYFPIGSTTPPFSNNGGNIPIDNTWRIYRNKSVLASMPSNAVYVDITIGRTGGAETFDAYVDDVAFGHSLDGQDMTRLNNVGTMAVHPFRYGSTAAGTFGKNVAGKHSARRFHSGYRSGTIQFTPFASGDVAAWTNFIDYCADGTKFSVDYDQGDGERDFISKAILNMDSDGLEQVAGSPYWRGSLDWREVP